MHFSVIKLSKLAVYKYTKPAWWRDGYEHLEEY